MFPGEWSKKRSKLHRGKEKEEFVHDYDNHSTVVYTEFGQRMV